MVVNSEIPWKPQKSYDFILGTLDQNREATKLYSFFLITEIPSKFSCHLGATVALKKKKRKKTLMTSVSCRGRGGWGGSRW